MVDTEGANTGGDRRRWDALWLGADLATMDGSDPKDPLGTIRDGALAVVGERIAWVGRRADLPGAPADLAATIHDLGGHDLDGAWLTPGLIDCHTHLVYGGDRAEEFRLRLHGASYEAIAAAGGGILSTVRATRTLDEDALVAAARLRFSALAAEGVTTVEIKSGYGLDIETELRMLRAAVRLGAESGLRVVPTLLAAHAIPPEHAADPDAYVDLICRDLIPAAAGLAQAVDAFGERIAFSPSQVARVFEAARRHGLPVKLHADQLSDQGGGALAARFGALSADHLEYLSEAGVAAMAEAGTVAVLLPGAFYTLRETKLPPVDALRRAGVPMALATDCNPGTSPATSLLLMLNMGCTLFRLTPEEALAGVTVHAARALGLGDRVGRLAPGLQADFVAWDIGSPAELAYRIGFNPARQVVAGGALQRRRAQSSTVSITARSTA